MNTRRSFFKSLAILSAAAAGCPGVFIPKFEPVKWKRIIQPRGLYFVEFHYAIKDFEKTFEQVIFYKRDGTQEIIKDKTEADKLFTPFERETVHHAEVGKWSFTVRDMNIGPPCDP